MNKIRAVYKLPSCEDINLLFNYCSNNTIAGVNERSKIETSKLLIIEIMREILKDINENIVNPNKEVNFKDLLEKVLKSFNIYGVQTYDLNTIIEVLRRSYTFYLDYVVNNNLYGHNIDVIEFNETSITITLG